MVKWRERGFAAPPYRVVASGTEVLYRVGGGPLSLPLGSFFSPLKVDRVSQADSHLNIVRWGNRCSYVATYRVRPGTVMWVGRVAHGRRDIGSSFATQVYIECPFGKVTLVRDIEALKQDVSVAARAGHA